LAVVQKFACSKKKRPNYFKIIFKWGSDWMILCKLLGINGPNSDYPCLLCACHKNDLGNWFIHEKNMVDNATTYVRTNKLQNETLANKKAKKKWLYIRVYIRHSAK
jgi:hypothetical protein